MDNGSIREITNMVLYGVSNDGRDIKIEYALKRGDCSIFQIKYGTDCQTVTFISEFNAMITTVAKEEDSELKSSDELDCFLNDFIVQEMTSTNSQE